MGDQEGHQTNWSLDPSIIDGYMSDYLSVERIIRERIDDFERIWIERDGTAILKELYFCLLTPQSKARVCWNAVERMEEKGLLEKGSYENMVEITSGIRFKYTKARRIIKARERFIQGGELALIRELEMFPDHFRARDFLVFSVNGFGLKEASHFLRNIGLGSDLAILDRHILRNLARAGVMEKIPSTLSRKKYLELESRMKDLSTLMNIPLSHLDLLLWYRETGEVFK